MATALVRPAADAPARRGASGCTSTSRTTSAGFYLRACGFRPTRAGLPTAALSEATARGPPPVRRPTRPSSSRGDTAPALEARTPGAAGTGLSRRRVGRRHRPTTEDSTTPQPSWASLGRCRGQPGSAGRGRRPPPGPAHADEWAAATPRSPEDGCRSGVDRCAPKHGRAVRCWVPVSGCPGATAPRARAAAVPSSPRVRRPPKTDVDVPRPAAGPPRGGLEIELRDAAAGARYLGFARSEGTGLRQTKRGGGSWWESSPLLSGEECVGVVGCSGGVLLSHDLSVAVPSALEGLASGFGMGPGVSPPL